MSHARTTTSWDATHRQYTCRDDTRVEVPCKTAFIRDLNKEKTLLSNWVRYVRDSHERLQPRIAVSGVEFDRGMKTLLGGPYGIRTIIFPHTLKIVRQAAFSYVRSLRKAALNEGLMTLGTNELTPNGNWYPGVFQDSGLRGVRLPSTLRKIEY